jgi:hypothetical protein
MDVRSFNPGALAMHSNQNLYENALLFAFIAPGFYNL